MVDESDFIIFFGMFICLNIFHLIQDVIEYIKKGKWYVAVILVAFCFASYFFVWRFLSV